MHSINRARSVDAISVAQSYERISIRDSVNCQSHEQNEKITGSIDCLTNILSFSTKKCLQWPKWSYFGCPKINCVTLFLRISSWVCYRFCFFFVSGTIIWLFIELSEQILIFSFFFRFFSWFWRENYRNSIYFLVYTVWTENCMIFPGNSRQNHEKNREKKEKIKICSDSSINNHIIVTETKKKQNR